MERDEHGLTLAVAKLSQQLRGNCRPLWSAGDFREGDKRRVGDRELLLYYMM